MKSSAPQRQAVDLDRVIRQSPPPWRSPRDLLEPGQTCWKLANAGRVKFLIDAAAYLEVLRDALKQAQRCVYIVGWDIDSRAPIHGQVPPDDGLPTPLLALLNHLLKRNKDLRVYVLSWDFALFYALERELFPSYRFRWKAHRRLAFALDGVHPLWASHHQKMVVIDDEVAFLGGIDLSVRRWDTSAHDPENHLRRDPSGVVYPPVHDVQVGVQGPIARDLGAMFRERWNVATGRKLDPPPQVAQVSLPHPDLLDTELGIARTRTHASQPCIQEVQANVLAAIKAARRYIYIENQYLTSGAVGEALAERLLDPDGPEVLVVLPKQEQGWLEQESLGVLRFRLLQRLRRDDKHGRLHVTYPFVKSGSERVPIYVHSKVLIIDDEYLKIGSSNMTNRSMGLDTECDLVFVASDAAALETPFVIQRVRNQLLSEHLGTTAETFAKTLAQTGSLIAATKALDGNNRGLDRLEVKANPDFDFSIYDGLVCDPEQPRTADALLDAALPTHGRRSMRRSLVFYASMAVFLVAAVLALKFSDLGHWLKPQALADASSGLLAQPGGLFVAAAVAAVALCLFVPVTVVITAGALLLPPWTAFFVLYATALVAASLSFAMGKHFGVPPLGAFVTRAAKKLQKHLQRGGFLAVLLARLLPVGNFTAINLVAGAVGVPFFSYLAANAVGLLPGLVLLCLFSGRVSAVWKQPSVGNVAAAIVSLVVLVAALAGLRALIRRRLRSKDAKAMAADGIHG